MSYKQQRSEQFNTMWFFLCAFLMTISSVQGLQCKEGYTTSGPDSGEFNDANCGTGDVYCEYRASNVEDGYELRCATPTSCESDEEDPLWKDVTCCDDVDFCNDEDDTSSATRVTFGNLLLSNFAWFISGVFFALTFLKNEERHGGSGI